MMHQSGQAAWLGFRDVLQVNGNPCASVSNDCWR
jgi:hypothetical protein